MSPILEEVTEGLRVTIRRGKTDQEGRGGAIAIVRGEIACPVMALRAWLDAANITEGPLFRPIRRGGHVQVARLTDRSVANIVKQHAERAGLSAGRPIRAIGYHGYAAAFCFGLKISESASSHRVSPWRFSARNSCMS